MLIYDLEIVNAIPEKGKTPEPGIVYCDGWGDKAGMGVSCVCAYDTVQKRFRVFTATTFWEFADLAKEHTVVGFHSIQFDDEVLRESAKLEVNTAFDLKRELQSAAGVNPHNHTGFSLHYTAIANGFEGKSDFGENAPTMWQRGSYGAVIDYCQNDVRMLALLMRELYDRGGVLNDPRDPANKLQLDMSKLPTEFAGY